MDISWDIEKFSCTDVLNCSDSWKYFSLMTNSDAMHEKQQTLGKTHFRSLFTIWVHIVTSRCARTQATCYFRFGRNRLVVHHCPSVCDESLHLLSINAYDPEKHCVLSLKFALPLISQNCGHWVATIPGQMVTSPTRGQSGKKYGASEFKPDSKVTELLPNRHIYLVTI